MPVINPWVIEGKKTCGLEIAEQTADRPPDWVVVSVGDGCTIAGIGQGFILATPLQLAVMTARVANGGYAVTPRLIQGALEDSTVGRELPSLGLSETSLDLVRQGMNRVTNHPRGTAFRARPLRLAAKSKF